MVHHDAVILNYLMLHIIGISPGSGMCNLLSELYNSAWIIVLWSYNGCPCVMDVMVLSEQILVAIITVRTYSISHLYFMSKVCHTVKILNIGTCMSEQIV